MVESKPSKLPNVDRKLFVLPIQTSLERNPNTETTSTTTNIFIKKDYLPSPAKQIKAEKTRDEVTRILNFSDENSTKDVITNSGPITLPISSVEHTTELAKSTVSNSEIIKQNPVVDVKPNKNDIISQQQKITSLNISENKENANIKTSYKVNYLTNESTKSKVSSDLSTTTQTSTMTPKKSESNKHIHIISNSSSRSSEQQHHGSSNSTNASGSSGKDYKSSSRRSSSSSNRECSRCYKRSKIKRTSIGIQCNRQQIASNDALYKSITSYPRRDLNCGQDFLKDYKYGRFFHIEVHSNGGASFVHMYQDEINALSKEEMDELVVEYFSLVFSEDDEGNAFYVMGIVHDAAAYLPDLLEHMSDNYSTLTVKAGVMGRNSDIETSTMREYNEQVRFFFYI